MKISYSILIILFISSIACFGQQQAPELLESPKEWRFERIDLPFEFAPDIDYDGFEELRFAPGMFDTLSTSYFTYVFAIMLSDKNTLSDDELKQFLLSYYKGLCSAVATSRQLDVDTSKINVSLLKTDNLNYKANINFYDVFTNSKEVLLHLEIELLPKGYDDHLVIFTLVSPQPKDHTIWNELYDIKGEFINKL